MNKAESGGLASREPYWEEDSTEGKVERLREEVARLCKVVTEQTGLLIKLGVHQHGADGKLLIPMLDERNHLGLFAHDNGIPHRLRTPRDRR